MANMGDEMEEIEGMEERLLDTFSSISKSLPSLNRA